MAGKTDAIITVHLTPHPADAVAGVKWQKSPSFAMVLTGYTLQKPNM
jgi:hypothetical protein